MLIAHPTERLAAVHLDGLTATGAVERTTIERWATDLLDVEAWAMVRPHPASAGHVIVQWFTRPQLAAAAACRHYTPAGHGLSSFSPAQVMRPRILPTTTTVAAAICNRLEEHTHA